MAQLITGLLWFVASVLLGSGGALDIPKGHLLLVDHECGNTAKLNKPIVHIRTDLHILTKAYCKNGVFNFTSVDPSSHDLNATFQDSSSMCTFKKVPNAQIYTIRVEIYWGEIGGPIHTPSQEHIITCTFDDKVEQKTNFTKLKEPLLAPKDIAYHVGGKTTSVLTLDVVDVRHKVITKSVQKGRHVRLMATSDGKNNELGIKPVSCDAVGMPSRFRHAIIRAGCGDGSIFKVGTGFVTKGLKSFSPYFMAFQLNKDTSIDFECNLTLCAQNCDGNSCTNERRRRSYDENEKIFFTKSKILIISDTMDMENDLPMETNRKHLNLEDNLISGYVTKKQLWVAMAVFGFLIFLTMVMSMYSCFFSTSYTLNDQCTCNTKRNCACDDVCMCKCSCNKPSCSKCSCSTYKLPIL
ncbi:vitelline envelope sperm lysin receptor [Patella vulgata]|uniref:vitelline envelope sperm lysin receptor n=1 Tax=Patella vulgata TaxID=6465 RepID=UPI00217F6A27|nr:vitelline envelope sperm lysin receptor [Patella vulgata]